MDFSFAQFKRFAARKVNQVVNEATGVDVMSQYNHARYEASAVGINVDPTQLLRRVDPTGPGSTAPRPKLTSKCALAGSVEQFLKLREKQAREPLGAAVCLVHALLNWAEPATREAGRQMLVLAAAEELLVEGSTYKRYALNPELEAALAQALPGAVAAVRSLVAGTAAAVGYAFDPGAVRLAHDAHAEEGQDEKAGVYTVWLLSTGDSSPRSVTLTVNKNGIWKARDFAALLREVLPPPPALAAAAADDL